MRRFILVLFPLLIAVTVLVACNSTEESTPPGALFVGTDGTQRITAEGLHDLWVKDKVLVVDTRGDQAFETGHIKGAIVITTNEVLAKADTLPRDKLIVFYCT